MSDGHHGFAPSAAEDALRRRVKTELRKRMRGLRKAMPSSACSERSARIVERLLALEPVRNARSIGLFWPIEERHEVDLRLLDGVLRQRGVRVAYPTVDPETNVMTFRFVAHTEAMQEGGFGCREPSPLDPEAQRGDVDVVVIPSLAVDPTGHRIGYGAGYYDRTLPRFAPPAVTVAVGFDFQLVAETPVTDGDVPAGWIVTDSRTMQAEGAR